MKNHAGHWPADALESKQRTDPKPFGFSGEGSPTDFLDLFFGVFPAELAQSSPAPLPPRGFDKVLPLHVASQSGQNQSFAQFVISIRRIALRKFANLVPGKVYAHLARSGPSDGLLGFGG